VRRSLPGSDRGGGANFSGCRDDVDDMEPRESDAAGLADSVVRPARFSQFYERHLAAVAIFLARRVGNELAEDLTAEVFARAFRGRTTFRPDHETGLPWLLGIANHLVADHRRAERRRLAVLQRLQPARSHFDPDPFSHSAPELMRQLRRLPDADRDTLLLVVWGELSYAEAASALGIPIGTVRSRIARARQRLAAAIGVGRNDPAAVHRPATDPGDVNA
jgi:RNA polymerase sigma factor (sigma-70 family)